MNSNVSLFAVQAEIAQARSMLTRLQQVARVNLARHAADVTNHQPMNDTMLGSDLYKLAVDVTKRPLILRAALLDVFCEPEASAILLSLPNLFWFWHVLSASVDKALVGQADRISARAVSASLAEGLSNQIGQRQVA